MTASGNDCEPPAVFVLGVPIGLGPTCTITFNVSYQYFGQCVDEVTYTYMSHTCPSQGSAGSGSGSGSGSGGSGGGPPYGGGGSQPSTTIDLTFCSGLSSTQRANIEDAIQEAASLNCATHVINMALANKPGLEIGICVDGTNGSGTYNAATKSITFLTDFASTHVDVVRHELFHAYQDNIAYPGGISDYSLGEPGYSNIEFEQALFKDIMMLHGGNATALSYSTDNDIIEEYESWINYLTNNGTEYPDFSNNWSLYESKYFEFLEEFKNTNPYYNAPIINTLAPEGLKRLFYGMLQPDCEY